MYLIRVIGIQCLKTLKRTLCRLVGAGYKFEKVLMNDLYKRKMEEKKNTIINF